MLGWMRSTSQQLSSQAEDILLCNPESWEVMKDEEHTPQSACDPANNLD